VLRETPFAAGSVSADDATAAWSPGDAQAATASASAHARRRGER
jgi:hypothetical protein